RRRPIGVDSFPRTGNFERLERASNGKSGRDELTKSSSKIPINTAYPARTAPVRWLCDAPHRSHHAGLIAVVIVLAHAPPILTKSDLFDIGIKQLVELMADRCGPDWHWSIPRRLNGSVISTCRAAKKLS